MRFYEAIFYGLLRPSSDRTFHSILVLAAHKRKSWRYFETSPIHNSTFLLWNSYKIRGNKPDLHLGKWVWRVLRCCDLIVCLANYWISRKSLFNLEITQPHYNNNLLEKKNTGACYTVYLPHNDSTYEKYALHFRFFYIYAWAFAIDTCFRLSAEQYLQRTCNEKRKKHTKHLLSM